MAERTTCHICARAGFVSERTSNIPAKDLMWVLLAWLSARSSEMTWLAAVRSLRSLESSCILSHIQLSP
ncbi:hypothetical protein F2Q68_00033640 [Brassica cretica]|uniref:Uncharacterized protein n=2 Tax=Brassica cretica TaxID=69181 RepID=A0A3N6QVI6_BRACR|nr:hypothetical protein F2Q68_00033640 [Brassica cretica]KAF3597620.1 hypothetical protein DY000_02020662 [Brassica cretica]